MFLIVTLFFTHWITSCYCYVLNIENNDSFENIPATETLDIKTNLYPFITFPDDQRDDGEFMKSLVGDMMDQKQESQYLEVLQQAVEKELNILMPNFNTNDEMYQEAKLDAIAMALENAFLKTTGYINWPMLYSMLKQLQQQVSDKQSVAKYYESNQQNFTLGSNRFPFADISI
ncbi:hypothetical protein X975_07809, partial [Stegodyphus mimosarum]